MDKPSVDQFVFSANNDPSNQSKSQEIPSSGQSNKPGNSEDNKTVRKAPTQNRKAQIQALIEAKHEVEAKLNEIFREEARALIFSIANISEVDSDRVIHLLVQALHMQVSNYYDSSLSKSKPVEELLAALDQLNTVTLDDGEAAWLATEFYGEWEKTAESGPEVQVSAA